MKKKIGIFFILILVLSSILLLINEYIIDNDILFITSFIFLIVSLIGVFKYTKNPMEIICNLIDLS